MRQSRLFLSAFLVCWSAAPVFATSIISNSQITVFGTLFSTTYPPEATIDDNLTTFWHGLNNIQLGQTNYLAYRFANPYSLSAIDFYENYQNRYLLGELDIQASADSTNGLDGTWSTIDHIAGDFNPASGDFTRSVTVSSTEWLRLFMTYEGRAAHGVSPAFYLTEIDFHGDPAPPTPPQVPEPSSVVLVGTGLAGAILSRRRGRK